MKASCIGYLDCYNITVTENQETAPDIARKDTRYNVTLRYVLATIVAMGQQ